MTEVIKINLETVRKLFGTLDQNARFIEKESGVKILASPDGIAIEGDEINVRKAADLAINLVNLISRDIEIDRAKIKQTMDILESGTKDELLDINREIVAVSAKGKHIKCKTQGQAGYVKAIKNNTVVFGIGPAGTGKTYLAVALAFKAFREGAVERLILTRPALEAGEKLGFLPGDLQEKIDPYLRPLYDALGEMFGLEGYQKLMEKGLIEAAPLAYMRGRTLSNAFIILDEAQNTTEEQMKMFLTRLGSGSKMVVTGDITQIDLPFGARSGLKHAANILRGVEDIAVCELTAKDVVRHELVQRIVAAYDEKKD